jgi:hypothetical protein
VSAACLSFSASCTRTRTCMHVYAYLTSWHSLQTTAETVKLHNLPTNRTYSDEMLAACAAVGMKPVCNHPGYCKTDPRALYLGQNSHLSINKNLNDPKQTPPRFKYIARMFDNTCSYCSMAQKGQALCASGNSHGWRQIAKASIKTANQYNEGFVCGRIKAKAKAPDTPCRCAKAVLTWQLW